MPKIRLWAKFNADTAEGADVTFKLFREGANYKRDKPIEIFHTVTKDYEAWVDWEVYDVRQPDDKTPLKYFYTIDTFRAKTAVSNLVTVVCPRLLGVKWEPEFIVHKQKAKLTISTFEAIDLTWKVQFWLRGPLKPSDPVFEYLESGERLTVPALLKDGKYVPDFSVLDKEKYPSGSNLAMRFWKNGRPEPHKMVYEQEVTFDQDDKELEFDLVCVSDSIIAGLGDYQIVTEIITDDDDVAKRPQEALFVALSAIEE